MERRSELDIVGGTLRPRRHLKALEIALIFLVASAALFAQDSQPLSQDNLRKLFDGQQWLELVREIEPVPERSADVDYYYGMALAQLARWPAARAAFLAGRRLQPKDKRFPTELAGVAFQEKHYGEAIRWLHRALPLDPRDIYLKDFLGTVYLLQGNLDAALKYWNAIDKPLLDSVLLEPSPRVHAALLDRAFAFSRGSVLLLPEVHQSGVRVRGLGIFANPQFDLVAKPGGGFDVVFHAQERNGFGNGKWDALLSTFSGVPYQTLYPAYFNIHRNAINLESVVRWDKEKRRLQAALSAPLRHNPKFRVRLGIDLRNENWSILAPFRGAVLPASALNLRREAAILDVASFSSGRWSWSTGVESSHRDYRSVFVGSALTPGVLLQGYQLKHLAQVNYVVLRIPERRFVVSTSASSQAATIWSSSKDSFAKLRTSMDAIWHPAAQGDDYTTRATIAAGTTFGQAPFDELFMLGLERDNDLPMRAHIGTRDGKKGSAPLGRNYFLSNSEMDKKVYSDGFFTVQLGPFVDIGRINGPRGLGSTKWLYDAGAQAKLRALGVGVVFTYGKDLRSGRNAFYATAELR